MTEIPGVERRSVPRTAATEFAYKLFGGQVTLKEGFVTVDLTPVALVKNNSERTFWTAQNMSGSDIRMQYNEEVAVGAGLLLAANGGLIESSLVEDGMLTGWAMYAIGPVAGLSVYVMEISRYTARKE